MQSLPMPPVLNSITDPVSSVNVHLKSANTDAVLVGSVTGDVSIDRSRRTRYYQRLAD